MSTCVKFSLECSWCLLDSGGHGGQAWFPSISQPPRREAAECINRKHCPPPGEPLATGGGSMVSQPPLPLHLSLEMPTLPSPWLWTLNWHTARKPTLASVSLCKYYELGLWCWLDLVSNFALLFLKIYLAAPGLREFPGGPMIRSWHFTALTLVKKLSHMPQLRACMPQGRSKTLHTLTKIPRCQISKKKKKINTNKQKHHIDLERRSLW